MMLPLGSLEDGSPTLAWPQMAVDAYNGAVNSYGDVSEGQRPRTGDIAAAVTAPVMGSTFGLATGAIPKGALGIFGGPLAKTADKAALKAAQRLDATGAGRREILERTGWFKGADGHWRFEIDDSGAKYSGGEGKLNKVLDHPALFEAYPQLGKTNVVKYQAGFPDNAYYQDPQKQFFGLMETPARIGLGEQWENFTPENVMLHEAQHAVQGIEGFAQGGNLGSHYDLPGTQRSDILDRLTKDNLEMFSPRAVDANPEKAQTLARKLAEEAIPGHVYDRLAGEVEARAVQARQHMPATMRRDIGPWNSYDHPASDQYIIGARSPVARALSGE